MEIFQIAAVGIISALIAVTLKGWRPELAAAVGIAAGTALMLSMAGALEGIFAEFDAVISKCGIAPEYFRLVIKLTGIAYITKFAGEICRDCGENAIAAKVELAGKVAVLSLTVPVISAFLNLVIETLNSF
jgi:stage III sporulation protein AD